MVHRSAAKLPRRGAEKTHRPLLVAAALALVCTLVILQSQFVCVLLWATCKRGANYRQLCIAAELEEVLGNVGGLV